MAEQERPSCAALRWEGGRDKAKPKHGRAQRESDGVVGAACEDMYPAGESPAAAKGPVKPRSDSRPSARVTAKRESSAVKVSGGLRRSDRYREANNWTGRSMKRTLQRRDIDPAEADAGTMGEPSLSMTGEGISVGSSYRGCRPHALPGVRVMARPEGYVDQSREGLSKVQAYPISAKSAKWVGDGETGGSGRSSDEACGQHNPGGAKDPWEGAVARRGKTEGMVLAVAGSNLPCLIAVSAWRRKVENPGRGECRVKRGRSEGPCRRASS